MNFHKPTFKELSGKEWLVTNGLGGFASSSFSGANTRRYHGLLIAALHPPTDRKVLVSKIEETIVTTHGTRIPLSSNQYQDAIHPTGYEMISSFHRDDFPVTMFEGDDWKISKMIFMVYHSDTTIIEYQNLSNDVLALELNPFYVHRDYHNLFTREDRFDFYREDKGDDVAVVYAHYGATPLYVKCPDAKFQYGAQWNSDILYARETERGLDDHEDICSNGMYTLQLKPGEKKYMMFTLESEKLQYSFDDLLHNEKERIASFKASIPIPSHLSKDDAQFYNDLIIAGEQFIVNRDSTQGQSIIAGYPWFTDWGRDTMIAMRGLVIAQGKKELAKNIINTFLMYLKDGLIPNRFPDHGETPEYNTIDASLWMFIVLHEYQIKFGDNEFIRYCLPKLKEILTAYRDGTHFNIHMTEEGLIYGGEDLTQLTWMDAKVGEYVVTPRIGCPVEINALWYNAIHIYLKFLDACQVEDDGWDSLAIQVKAVFRFHFLNDQGYLNDVVIPGDSIDNAIRPNQVYALSLPFSLLNQYENKTIMDCVTNHLLTPYGLRSLSPDHPEFIGFYGGDQWHRDKAYHQGTVWSYLMGEYMIAYLKVHEYSTGAKDHVLKLMHPLRKHFYNENCMRGISEVFDGENPHEGKGCIHQAWSIGMLLLVLQEM